MINIINVPKHHWNYFLAIERDLEQVSRYIEFTQDNLGTYSIELAHILLSASSEVDVVMKQLCELVAPERPAETIDHYRPTIRAQLANLIAEPVYISRYGLEFKPWEIWSNDVNPDWWRSYNKVKHQRNIHFNKANLQNTINAVGALLLTTLYYYTQVFSLSEKKKVNIQYTTYSLEPQNSFLTANSAYYYKSLSA
ncbi:hypothetical protein [Parachryseolinea silvisoli]|uniref:hypothetical protein n=1 Tax=Parachryseolinea silvisoli TaxID=2873601 RepID=UPI0022658758|nr:hypothetical protein [Parachryseolinea silvisoli]MCD9015194.1 hypothetical protein [Parachryseolinea silvisoli]